MAATQGTIDRRAGLIVASAFIAGVAWTAVISGPSLLEPAPVTSFRIDDVPVEAERPPIVVDEALPAAAADLVAPARDRRNLPERLALGDAPAPIAAAVLPQALPTSARDVEPVATAPTPTPAVDAEPVALEPTPADSPPIAAAEESRAGDEPPEPALKALVERMQPRTGPVEPLPPAEPLSPDAPGGHERAADVADAAPSEPRDAAAAPPLPGAEWNDPDGVNWTDAPGAAPREAQPSRGGRLLGRLIERRTDQRPEPPTVAAPRGGRLLDRLRGDRGMPIDDQAGATASLPPASRWPVPAALVEQLGRLAADRRAPAVAAWATDTLAALDSTIATAGPADPGCEEPLIALSDRVAEGMKTADGATDPALGSQVRRAALAVSRRVAVWRAAAACCAEIEAARAPEETAEVGPRLAAACSTAEVARLIDSVERFEATRTSSDAAAVRGALRGVAGSPLSGGRAVDRAIQDHYLCPNVRIAINDHFIERMLPESEVTTGPLQDYVLGRKVRGTKTVAQSTAVRFSPHPSEIRLDLLVSGAITSRTVTEAGAVEIHSRGQSTFTVFKPIQLSTRGLGFGPARGTASSQSRLADIETSFDAVPLMSPIVKGIVRSQHDGSMEEANREVNSKIVSRACREVDQQTEPKLNAMADRIRTRFWRPMDDLGLEPTAVALETSQSAATARLRLSADTQLAAHTPRPRAPDDALFSMQVHESTVNNACERFELAGRKLTLEELHALVRGRLGLPARAPEDLPEGVTVTFASAHPLRVECRDGLIHVHVTLDAIESGRRSNWYDIEAHVAYRPVTSGLQVMLEREGPVQLGGAGHKGRMDFALRTIFGKMFPKERPVKLVPETMTANPRLVGVQAVQAVSIDGWLAIALGTTAPIAAPKAATPAARAADTGPRLLRR
jgi:hypothetical protein